MNAKREPLQFRVYGLDCAEEVSLLKRAVGPVAGGEDRLTFDVLRGRMTVQPVSPEITEDDIRQAVARTGLQAERWQGRARDDERRGFWTRRGRTLLTTASGVCLLAAFLLHVWLSGSIRAALAADGLGAGDLPPWPVAVLYALAIVSGVWFVLPRAWRAARGVRPDMNLLMTVAVAGAVAIGEWFEAATVAFLFALSLLLESWSVGRARRAIAALLDLAPPTAWLRTAEGREEAVPAEQVPVGAVVIVRPGEKFPVDGRIRAGTSHVDQAPITGESQPVLKDSGDEVFAGTINGDGALEIVSTKAAADTTLARIVRMVEEAQSRRAPSEQWVEKFARYYTPAVMGLAVAVLLVPPLLLGGSWSASVYSALVLLVIACPCALVISTPVSIVAGLAAAARQGVLIKGGVFLEAPAHLRVIAFDKTGTLTSGQPDVTEIVPFNGHDSREILVRAAALETHSEHPLARAIVSAAAEQGVRPPPAEGLQTVRGKGATARFNGEEFWVGSHRFLHERGQETDEIQQRLETLSGAGRSVVVLGSSDRVWGLIALADRIRPEARAALDGLRRAGIQRLVMLTGDNQPTAQAIAAELGIDEVHAELLPADKVTAVEDLVRRDGHVAMIGDGVNDAPALARASLGIAMGAAGTDAAIETADIALMSDDLTRIPWLIGHSRRVVAVIRQNITCALAVKAGFVVLALLDYASLWAAIAADMGASLLVIFNGLRLLQSPAGGFPARQHPGETT